MGRMKQISTKGWAGNNNLFLYILLQRMSFSLPCLGAASPEGCKQAALGCGKLHLQETFTFLTVFFQLKKFNTSSYLRIFFFFFMISSKTPFLPCGLVQRWVWGGRHGVLPRFLPCWRTGPTQCCNLVPCLLLGWKACLPWKALALQSCPDVKQLLVFRNHHIFLNHFLLFFLVYI